MADAFAVNQANAVMRKPHFRSSQTPQQVMLALTGLGDQADLFK